VAGVEVAGVEEPRPAGDGVAGTGAVAAKAGWDGAAGGAGVAATAGAGVDGGFEDAGAALGYENVRFAPDECIIETYLGNHADNESFLFNLV